MSRIQPLSELCINKIAAGEVIERPSSVLKELVENALDAGATQINVHMEDGGKELIRIWDNGSGITPEDLKICYLRYTTSKLRHPDDLFGIQTNGFRGEALSSISAVAKLHIESLYQGNSVASYIKVEEGQLIEEGECAREQGTTIEVHNLFYNTPVRAKFLSSARGETTRIQQILTRLVLAHPHVGFSLTHGSKELLQVRAGESEMRLAHVLGAQNARLMEKINYSENGWSLTGFVSSPEGARPRKQHQYFYLGQRPIWNAALAKALERAYESLCPGRHAMAVLHLSVPAEEVDVNVHPAKREVRFSQEGELFSFIVRAIRDTLYQQEEEKHFPHVSSSSNTLSTTPSASFSSFSDTVEEDLYREAPSQEAETQDLFTLPDNNNIVSLHSQSKELYQSEESSPEPAPPMIQYLQIGGIYILAETQTGLILIDQFLAHQRVLYEKARHSLQNLEPDVSQQVLFPDIIELSPEESTLVENQIDYFLALGFDLALFGTNCFQIKGIPQDLTQTRAKESIADILMNLLEDKKTDIKERFARSFARFTAIPRGQKLSPEEMSKLVDQLFSTQNPYIAPNEKPTLVRITLEEITKKFGL